MTADEAATVVQMVLATAFPPDYFVGDTQARVAAWLHPDGRMNLDGLTVTLSTHFCAEEPHEDDAVVVVFEQDGTKRGYTFFREDLEAQDMDQLRASLLFAWCRAQEGRMDGNA